MRILVTGVYGFVGSTLIKKLVTETDHTVLGFGRLTAQKNLARIKPGMPRLSIINGDLTGDITELCEGIDVVIHTAAKTFVDHSIRSPGPFIQSNVVGTFNLLESARLNKVRRFIQVSTDEVYGPILAGMHTEESPINPSNPYAATKAAADFLAQSYHTTYGMDTIITRTENNVGPFQHPQKVFSTFVRKIMAGEKLPVYGDGRHRRMWIHVEDHCAALMFLMETGEAGQIYNVAGSQELENLELARRVLREFGMGDEMIEFIDDRNIRPGHDRRYAISSAKIRFLGWQPLHSLDETIRTTVQWYRDNAWWMI